VLDALAGTLDIGVRKLESRSSSFVSSVLVEVTAMDWEA
jgi:hypothetical protein